MLYFADAQYLWLLLLVPLFPVVYAIFRRMRKKRVASFGDPDLVAGLMPSYSGARGWWKVVLRCRDGASSDWREAKGTRD